MWGILGNGILFGLKWREVRVEGKFVLDVFVKWYGLYGVKVCIWKVF